LSFRQNVAPKFSRQIVPEILDKFTATLCLEVLARHFV